MKKIIAFALSLTFVSISFAQVQRNTGTSKQQVLAGKTPSGTAVQNATAQEAQKNKMRRKQMMHELKLTREQKGKLKETNRAAKAKMNEIKNDPALSDADKKAKLKELRAGQQKSTAALLTDEQRAKLKELQQKNHPGKKHKKNSGEQ